MRVDIYVFVEKFVLVDPENIHPIDDHLIRAKHIESIYDVLKYVGSVDLEELEKVGLKNIVDKLRRNKEVTIYDRNVVQAIEKALKIKIPPSTTYIVLRLAQPTHMY